MYPLDVTFIRDLAPAFARKWIQAGWDIGKTALLEINHPTIPANVPLQTGTPSELFSGLVYAWSKQVYFKVAAFSRGFFDNANDLVLKINAWHEKQHIINAQQYLHNGMRTLTEEEIAKKEVEYVLKTFGREGFQARRNKLFSDLIKLENSNAIPGFLAILWLREYFGKYRQKYTQVAFPIPSTEYAKTLCQQYSDIASNSMKIYDVFEEDVSKLFKHTMEDIGN